jgi:hypothetical protein
VADGSKAAICGAIGGRECLVDELAGSRAAAEQRAYEDALKAALDPYRRDTGGPPAPPAPQARRRASRSHTQPAAARPTTECAAPPDEPTSRPGEQVGEDLQVGAEVAVLRETWPQYACKEMGGLAWHAIVVARAAGRATVRFNNNCTRGGRRYEDVRLLLEALRHVA